MTSTQKGTVFQMVKTNKIGSKVAVSAHKRSEVHSSNPQQGQGYFLASSQRSAAVSLSPSAQRRSEAAHPTTPHSASDYPRSSSPEPGPGFSAAQFSRGTESRPRMEAFRHSSPHRKNQQVQTTPSHAVSSHRNASPLREESARRGGENKPVREVSYRGSLTPDAKSSRRLSFLDQKDNYQSQTFQEEDPPSKVQNPQGIRVPLRISIHPKDEAVQTDPIRRTLTTSEVRSPKSPYYLEQGSSRLTTDHRAVLRKIPTQEPEMGPYSSIPSEPKASHRNINLESSLKLSVLRDLDGRHRVPSHSEPESLCKHPVYAETKPSSKVLMVSQVESNMRSPIRGDTEVSRKVTISPGQSIPSTHRATTRTVSEGPHKSSMFVTPEHVCKEQSQRPAETNYMSPGPTLRYQESSQKPPIHAELELTPRPLPPRSLPKYGPESSWWGLLNPEAEMSQSWPTTPDFEPKPSPPLDPFMSLLEMNSSPFCEDLMFQREKASPPPPPPPPPKESPSWAPMMEVPKAPKHTCKQPIQRFSAFFLGM